MSAVAKDWYGKFLGVIRTGIRHGGVGQPLAWDVKIPFTITEAGKNKTAADRRVWIVVSPEDALKYADQIRTAALDAIRAREEA